MSAIRTLPAVIVAHNPTPCYTGAVVTAVSFSITNGIATVTLGSAAPVTGTQVILWGFTTASYFNGARVTVLDNQPGVNSFRFYFDNADVGSTADAGNTAPAPVDKFRVVRIECGLGNGTDFLYVGDSLVSSARYAAALSLTGQRVFEIQGQNIDASQIFLAATGPTDVAQVSVEQ